MKIMSVDFGDARTGLAMCDRTEFLASPLGVIQERRFDDALDKVAAAAHEFGAEMIVVGLPLNMNGSEGERAGKCREFGRLLGDMTCIKTVMWDERQTTVSATNYLNLTDTRGKKRKEVIDAVAAVIILESYLAYRKNHPDCEITFRKDADKEDKE